MVDTLVVIYLGGWILATPGAYAAGRRWNDRQSPAPHPFWASLFAGAVWPLLLVGLLELSSVIVYTKAIQAWWRRRHLRLAPSVSLKVLPLNTFGGEAVAQWAAEPPYRGDVVPDQIIGQVFNA